MENVIGKANRNLGQAKGARNDEFYTQRVDIDNEVSKYAEHFRDKVILCNCNDAESKFFEYFKDNFIKLGLKRLIGISYDKFSGDSYYVEVIFDSTEQVVKESKHKIVGNDEYMGGDFRSDDCLDLLKQSDIVVTNPPFSLFREYMALVMKYKKSCLILGNLNATTYKEIFPLIQSGKLWLGTYFGDMSFKVPKWYQEMDSRYWVDDSGQKWRSLGNACWYTNLDIDNRHKPLELSGITYSGNEENYPKFDGYDAINVDKLQDIPCDYGGIMGVPTTFMTKHCPEQFDIVGIFKHGCDGPWDLAKCMVNGIEKYTRIAIRARNPMIHE